MVDPTKITNFNLSKNELEEVLLFWICAAGKKASTSARCLDELLKSLGAGSPFDLIRNYKGNLPKLLKRHGIGCYNNKARTFKQLVNSGFNLKTCSLEDLLSINGIGNKTARCFLMHSRENVRHAGLDTHIKKYLKLCGYDVPNTLSSKQYEKYENIFLSIADVLKENPAELDLKIWNYFSGGSNIAVPIIYNDVLGKVNGKHPLSKKAS